MVQWGNIPLGEGFALTYFYSRLYIMQHQATAATYFSALKCTLSLSQPLKTGSSPRITIFVSLSNSNLSDNIAWKTTIRVFPAALLALSSLFTVLSSEFLNIWSKIAIHISDLACHWKLLTSWACDKTKEDFPEFPDRSWFILACPHLNVEELLPQLAFVSTTDDKGNVNLILCSIQKFIICRRTGGRILNKASK